MVEDARLEQLDRTVARGIVSLVTYRSRRGGLTMRSVRRRTVVAGVFAIALLGLLAQPAAAIHSGATLDCGSAGTFTIKTGENGTSVFKPGFIQVVLLGRDDKVVGTLVPFRASVNGVPIPLVSNAAGNLEAHHGLATCSFTGSNGERWVLEGILNLR